MKTVLLIVAIIVLIAIARPLHKPQPYTPEQYRDLASRVVEACRTLPPGDRNRPSKEICGY